MVENSLQAVLNRVKVEEPSPAPTPAKPKGRAISAKVPANQATPTAGQTGRGDKPTKLIGGHFQPEVSAQLRMIAAEEGTTIQKLLGEALDDLFVKKGKTRISL